MKTSAECVAAGLAEGIVRSADLLHLRLEEEGFAWTDPDRAGTDECLLECTLFEWFLRDIMVSHGGESRTEAVHQALAGRLMIDLLRSGLSVASLGDFDQRRRERFREYTEGLAVSSSLQALGALAWRRISGRDRPSERMTMLLAVRARAELADHRSSAHGSALAADV
jgi:hypothetical protein